MNNQGNYQELDSFEQHAKTLLSVDIFNQLIELRQQHMSKLYKMYEDNPSLTGRELNHIHNAFFQEVSQLIGAEKYEQLFGFSTYQEVHLIDEEIFDEQQSLRKK